MLSRAAKADASFLLAWILKLPGRMTGQFNYAITSDQVQQQGQQNKGQSDPLGPFRKLGVSRLGLGVRAEGIAVGGAGDGAGQAGALTGLEKHDGGALS